LQRSAGYPGVVEVMTGRRRISFGILPISEGRTCPGARQGPWYGGRPRRRRAAVDEATAEEALALFQGRVELLPSFMTV